MASPEFHALVAKMRSRPRQLDQTIEQARAGMVATSQAFPPSPDAVFERVEANGVRAEWVKVPGSGQSPVILYFHGGGYCIGSAETHRDLVSRLCTVTGGRALSVDYRLAPENPFPAAVDDGVAAYRWLRSQGVPAKSIAVAGDSAGGGLALATLLALKEAGDALPAGGVCISPVTDHMKEGESMRTKIDLDPMVHPTSSTAYSRRYLGGADPKAPLASPLYADLRGLPPLLILVGTWEVLLDDSTRFAAKAKESGVPVELEVWEEMIHIWPYFAKAIPEGRQAIDRMGVFIKKHAGASSPA
ncbi:alpha/beta hydrolase [Reyranella sp.]|uniref:alpha/beta hydrolase n=1 Tax=Reyranella sp. TaxID=1929291 RepID=UPI003783786E